MARTRFASVVFTARMASARLSYVLTIAGGVPAGIPPACARTSKTPSTRTPATRAVAAAIRRTCADIICCLPPAEAGSNYDARRIVNRGPVVHAGAGAGRPPDDREDG